MRDLGNNLVISKKCVALEYQIVELSELSGDKATIYSVILGDEGRSLGERGSLGEGGALNEGGTLLDNFVSENVRDYKKEVTFIVNRLKEMGHKTGAREIFFKHGEGKPGDGVCALYDEEGSKLRLYCIRYGSMAIILGGGGPKSHTIRAWEEDEKLTKEARRMIRISKDIMERIKNRDLRWSQDGKQLLGNLTISDNE